MILLSYPVIVVESGTVIESTSGGKSQIVDDNFAAFKENRFYCAQRTADRLEACYGSNQKRVIKKPDFRAFFAFRCLQSLSFVV